MLALGISKLVDSLCMFLGAFELDRVVGARSECINIIIFGDPETDVHTRVRYLVWNNLVDLWVRLQSFVI